MKSIFLILLSQLIINTASAEDFLDKKTWRELVKAKNIIIDNPFGEVRLRYGDGTDIIEYNAIYQQLQTDQELVINHHKENGTLTIKSELNQKKSEETTVESKPKNHQGKSRVDLLVYIPQNKNLVVKTDQGLIEAKGLKTNTNLESKSGKITVKKHVGPLSTHNINGETVLILEDQGIENQKFSSVYGPISALIDESSNLKISASTSGDITSDFSTKITKQRNEEPNKTAIISLNKAKSTIVFYSKRGNIAIREYKHY